MKRVEIFRVNSKITVPMNNSLFQTSNFKFVTVYSACKAVRFLLILALVLASGVLRLHGQIDIDCGLSIDATLTDEFTSNFASDYFENKVLEIEGTLTVDENTSFTNCTFYMADGSSIFVAGFALEIENCKFGCDDWIGISGIGFFISRNSYYEKFATAFQLAGASAGLFTDNEFYSDQTGTGIETNEIGSSLYYVLVGIYSSQNHFNNCLNGIKSYSCPVGIFDKNSTYYECVNGIYSELSNIYVSNSEFSQCEYGIDARFVTTLAMEGNSSTNNFLNCSTAVQASYSTVNIINSKIKYTGEIFDFATGIAATNQAKVHVIGTEYSDETSFSYSHYFILAGHSEVIASDNIININAFKSSGFAIFDSPKTSITACTVNVISHNRLDGLPTGSTFAGIDQLNIQGNTFNSTIGVEACSKTGIFDNAFTYNSTDTSFNQFYLTNNNLFCENTFDNSSWLRFKEACQPTQLGTSYFLDGFTGLFAHDANISIQRHRGNKWSSSSYAIKTTADNTFFIVNPDIPTCDNPEYRPQNIVSPFPWFSDEPGCVVECKRMFSTFKESLDENDTLIINSSMSATALATWYQKLITYEKLWENPSLMDSYSAGEDFYDNCLNTDIEAVTKTHWFLTNSKHHTTYSPLLDTRNTQKLDLLEDIFELNALLEVAFDSTHSANLAVKVSQLNSVLTQIDQVVEYLEDFKMDMLDSAEYYNELIVGTENNFVEHEKLINSFVIARERDPLFLPESEEYEDLLDVALLCPEVYGKSVLIARTFIEHSVLMDELGETDPCTEELISSQKSSLISSVNIIPNPVKDILYIIGFKQEFKCNFQIFDTFGKLLNYGICNNSITTSGLDQGVYFLKLSNQNGLINSQKFIKL